MVVIKSSGQWERSPESEYVWTNQRADLGEPACQQPEKIAEWTQAWEKISRKKPWENFCFDEESSQQESDIEGYAMYCVLGHDKTNVHVISTLRRTLWYIDDIR